MRYELHNSYIHCLQQIRRKMVFFLECPNQHKGTKKIGGKLPDLYSIAEHVS